MNQLYKLFNVKSDREYRKVMENMDLSPYDMFKIEDIANNGQDLTEQRQLVLSLLALTTNDNYKFCKNQFNKSNTPRKLKENVTVPQEQSLTLNDIMELNDIIDLVAKKCHNNKMAYQQLYQVVAKSTSKNIANAFFNMAFNAQNTDDNLKFNTDLVVDNQNVAQAIYQIKSLIKSALNSIQEPKKEEKINESVLNEDNFPEAVKNIYALFHSNNNVDDLNKIISMLDNKINVSRSTKEKNFFNSIKTNVIAKLNKLKKDNVAECLASNVVSTAVEEDTFNGLLDDLAKPTIINITVNKETGNIDDVQPVLNDTPNMDLINGVQAVQPLTLSPTAIDAPILQKPNQASVVSALSALSSHLNDTKSDSRENNLECLQTINTLLNQISSYFNSLLSESKMKINNDGVMELNEADIFEHNAKPDFTYTFKTPDNHYIEFSGYKLNDNSYDIDLMDEDYNYITTSEFTKNGASDNNIKNNIIKMKQNWNLIEKALINKINTYNEDFQLSEDIDSKKLFKNDDAIARLQNEIIRIKQKLKEPTSDKKYYGVKLSYAETKLRKLLAKNDEIMNEETVYDHSWYENDDGDFPKRTKEGVIIEDEEVDETCSAGATGAGNVAMTSRPIGKKKKIVKEMSEFPKMTFLFEENNEYRKYAGIIDLNTNKLFYLPKGTHHLNFISEDDVFNGKIRFGVTPYKNKIVGYISSDSREHIMLALKKLKKELSEANIDFWMVEYYENGQRIRMNIDDSGRQIFENKNDWMPSWDNMKNKVLQEKFTIGESLLLKFIKEGRDCTSIFDGHHYMLKNGYLYKDAQLVKTKNLNEMVEFIQGNIDLPILDGFLPMHLDMMLEEDVNNPNELSDMDLTPEQRQLKQKQEQDLDTRIDSGTDTKVSVENTDDNKIELNQELVGVDDTDINNKQYVVKNPSTNKIKIVKSSQIKTTDDQGI